MRVLITGICGFVGSNLARAAAEHGLDWEIVGVDNLVRRGSEQNLGEMRRLGIDFHHADLRQASDFESLPTCEWIIDAAAHPSVLAGVDGQISSRQLVEHNLLGTLNLLEAAKRWQAGFVLLSTSRVYSIAPLAGLPVEVKSRAYALRSADEMPPGVTAHGISEKCSTSPPVSLYGATKLASECLALEYSYTFEIPCWINRCGILAGGGQFGRPDQGIIAFWIHSHRARRPLRFTGFEGTGFQVRDCLHPRDLISLLSKQLSTTQELPIRMVNVSGGIQSAISLRQLHDWCDDRFGKHPVAADPTARPFDLPWLVLDNRLAEEIWGWCPQTSLECILHEIAEHAERRPDWLDISGVR